MKKYRFLLILSTLFLFNCSSDTVIDPVIPVDPLVPVDPVNPEEPKGDELNDPNLYAPSEQAQIAYYSEINFALRGENLKLALRKLVTDTHHHLNYTPDIWEASKITDQDPENTNNVLLIYGWPDKDVKPGDMVHKRSLGKNEKYTNADERFKKWEREHVFAKSLAYPKLVTDTKNNNYTKEGLIAGTDAHNLRPINGVWNEERGNLRFKEGSGNAKQMGNTWYPGDEWKGDVARMMMYMYLRYDLQCKPIYVGSGKEVEYLGNVTPMLDVFLKWNAEDPVSEIEIQRNEYHGNPTNSYSQRNRNPFIDNPYLANLIWGDNYGRIKSAENKWVKK